MDSNIRALERERKDVLDDTVKEIKNWDGSYEMGIVIIEDVDLSIEELKRLNNLLESSLGPSAFTETYNEKMLVLAEEYEMLLKKLDIEKRRLLKLIQEIKLKEKVKDNYISRDKESVFIDKDL